MHSVRGVAVDLSGTGLQPGDSISGSFSHSDCTGSCADYYGATETSGYYYDLGITLDVALGGITLGSSPGANANEIWVGNYETYDRYAFVLDSYYPDPAGFTLSAMPATIDGHSVAYVWDAQILASLGLLDHDATAVDSGHIPEQLPLLDAFEQRLFSIDLRLVWYDEANDPHAADVFSAVAEYPVVPEPASALLFAAGLAAALAAGRQAPRARPGRRLACLMAPWMAV